LKVVDTAAAREAYGIVYNYLGLHPLGSPDARDVL